LSVLKAGSLCWSDAASRPFDGREHALVLEPPNETREHRLSVHAILETVLATLDGRHDGMTRTSLTVP
jgi:hypothetical protein